MPTYNYKARELIAKIVYYGPGRCGKTTNLQEVHKKMKPETRSELLSVATETDRTIYFDLLPLNLGTISGMKFLVRLFTVPGQVYYAETRKLVLRGADGVVFVADSQDHMIDENRESLVDLKTNLIANGIDYNSIPLVLQYNKRDLPRVTPEAELDAVLNDRRVKGIPAVASQGIGVLETLRYITVSVFNNIKAQGKVTGMAPRAQSRAPTGQAGVPPGIPAGITPPMGGGAPMPQPRVVSRAGSAVGAPPGQSRSAALEAAMAAAKNAGRAAVQSHTPPRPPPPPAPSVSRESSLPQNGPGRAGTSDAHQEIILDEFKNLAVLTAQLQERMAAVEQELRRLGQENQDLREHFSRMVQG